MSWTHSLALRTFVCLEPESGVHISLYPLVWRTEAVFTSQTWHTPNIWQLSFPHSPSHAQPGLEEKAVRREGKAWG